MTDPMPDPFLATPRNRVPNEKERAALRANWRAVTTANAPKATDHAALLATARALETWALDSGFPTAAKVIHNLLEALETEVANRLLTSPGSLSRTVAGISSALSASPDEKIPDDSSPQVADLILRLNVACIGRPHAKIPWPHRLLHDARETLQAQHKENTELRALLNASRSAQYTS